MKFLSLLLLLMLAVSVLPGKPECPSSEDLYPCKCGITSAQDNMWLECKNESMSLNELKSVLSHFTGKEKVIIELDNLDLGTVPSKLFEGIGVKKIHFSHCKIDSFEDDGQALLGLDDSLLSIIISSSLHQENVPLKFKFGHLKTLIHLQLENNKISELPDDWLDLKEYSLLFSISIQNNEIEKIGREAFSNIMHLEFFTLIGNTFGSLRRSMLPNPAPRLRRMHLSNNSLQNLPEDFFISMPSLVSITLSENEMKTIDRKTWEPILEQLEGIDLSDNPLQCDSDMHWLFNEKMPRKFQGTCQGPEGKEGLSLKEFLENGRHFEV